ncbi:unnamed protein product, partial [Ectocarpus sp. 4 AP-2014]
KNGRVGESPQVPVRRMTRGSPDLPDQKHLYAFMATKKGWKYAGHGWSVVGPENGCEPLEEAELPQYVVDRPELLSEYNEYLTGKEAGDGCSPVARKPREGEQ